MMTIEEVIQRDSTPLRRALAGSLRSLGWDRLRAKERGGVQTLLEHALAVYDVLAACLPFIAEDTFPPLTSDEALTMLLAAAAHDAGKADPSFQAYLGGVGAAVEHVDANTIRATVECAARAVGIDLSSRIDDVVSCAVLHDKRMRLDRGELATHLHEIVGLPVCVTKGFCFRDEKRRDCRDIRRHPSCTSLFYWGLLRFANCMRTD